MTSSQVSSADSVQRIVTHVINGEHYSGAERVQDLLALRLPEHGFEVSFACVKPNRFDRMRVSRETPLCDLPMRSRVDMRPVRRLVQLLRQNQSSLIHAHTPRSLMVARLAALMTGIPLVYHVHSPTSRDTNQPLRNWLNNATERFTLTGVDQAIAVSHSLERHMIAQGFDSSRICTVPNGVPVNPAGRGSSLPTDIWTIGTVALFRPRKGLEVLLETVAKLKKYGVPVRLRAVGSFESADYEQQIHRRTQGLAIDNLIEWVGFTQDVPSELAQCDLFVLPSLFGEGLPMVVLEAMAAGVPVVATRVEGVPEAIRNGEEGILVEPGDADALTDGVRLLVENGQAWQRCRLQALERHAAEFSDQRMAEQTADVYRQILDGTPVDHSAASCRAAALSRAGKSG